MAASACLTDTTPTSHTETPTHIETRTHNQCGDTIEKSQVPDDGCINVRNMLSIEEVKSNLINCDIKLVSYFDVWLTVHRSSMWIKRPTRCHLVIYLFLLYSLLNMFRATMCPSSGADDLVVFFRCVVEL